MNYFLILRPLFLLISIISTSCSDFGISNNRSFSKRTKNNKFSLIDFPACKRSQIEAAVHINFLPVDATAEKLRSVRENIKVHYSDNQVRITRNGETVCDSGNSEESCPVYTSIELLRDLEKSNDTPLEDQFLAIDKQGRFILGSISSESDLECRVREQLGKCINKNDRDIDIPFNQKFRSGELFCIEGIASFGLSKDQEFGYFFENGESNILFSEIEDNVTLYSWIFQSDGNLVLFDINDKPVWASNTVKNNEEEDYHMIVGRNSVSIRDQEGLIVWQHPQSLEDGIADSEDSIQLTYQSLCSNCHGDLSASSKSGY